MMSPQTKAPVLPQPKAKIDPKVTPFVGNVTVADNIREAVEVAIWTVLGRHDPAVTIDVVEGGAVGLGGVLPSHRHRREIVDAVRAINGVTSVLDHLEVVEGRTDTESPVLPGTMLYVRRFCASDEASTSAAIRQAIGRLETHFAEQNVEPGQLIVIYRNLRPQTVTVDIGMSVAQGASMASPGTLRVAPVPASSSFEGVAQPGFEALLQAIATLRSKAGLNSTDIAAFWQSFDLDRVRPWTGHPEATVHLAA